MEEYTLSPFEKELFASVDQLCGILSRAEASSTNSASPTSISYRAVKHLEGKINLAQCSLRTVANMGQPVNRLPPEILAIVFDYMTCLPSDTRWAAAKFMLTVAVVCKYWRDVALSHPTLWSYIILDYDNGDSVDIPKLQLSRSGSALLSVAIVDSIDGANDEVVAWLEEVLPDISARIERLSIDAADELIQILFHHPVPNLRHLHLYGIPEDFLLFDGHTPQLMRLQVWVVGTPPISLIRNLTHLHIARTAPGTSYSTFFDVLELNPMLEELIIWIYSPFAEPSNHRIVPLPNLRRFAVSGAQNAMIGHILSSLILCEPTTITATYDFRDHFTENVFPTVFIDRLAVTRACILTQDDKSDLRIILANETSVFAIELHRVEFLSLLITQVFAIEPLRRVQELFVDFSPSHLPLLPSLKEWLSYLPNLITLSVNLDEASMELENLPDDFTSLLVKDMVVNSPNLENVVIRNSSADLRSPPWWGQLLVVVGERERMGHRISKITVPAGMVPKPGSVQFYPPPDSLVFEEVNPADQVFMVLPGSDCRDALDDKSWWDALKDAYVLTSRPLYDAHTHSPSLSSDL